MIDRYKAMDSLVRAEFQRKDQAIQTLNNLLETHIRSLQTNLK